MRLWQSLQQNSQLQSFSEKNKENKEGKHVLNFKLGYSHHLKYVYTFAYRD